MIVSGDAYVDHPAFGPVLIARFLEGRGFRVGDHRPAGLAQRRAVPRARPAAAVLRGVGRQPRLDAEPAHRAEEEPLGRPVQPRRAHGLPPRPRHGRVRAALPRGVSRRAGRARRHRGVAAADRPLRLLERHRAPIDAGRRQGRPARVRDGRAAGLGGGGPACAGASAISEIRDVRGTAFIDRQRRDAGATRPTRRGWSPTARSWSCPRTRRSRGTSAPSRGCRGASSSRPIRATRGRWPSATAIAACTSTRRRFPSTTARAPAAAPSRWTSSTTCRSRGRRTRRTRSRSPATRP